MNCGADGAARLRFEDETVETTPDDFVNIPTPRRHEGGTTRQNEPTG
jgi:hypothetical protein